MLKEQSALRIIESALSVAADPIVLESFGKDSVALLHLVRRVRSDVPVLFFFEATASPEKVAFARHLCDLWNLQVFTYEPSGYDIVAGSGDVEIICKHSVGGDDFLYLPLGTEKSPTSQSTCTLDIIGRPVLRSYSYQWDTSFCGHRSEDTDPVHGNIRLTGTSAKLGDTLMVYPLHDWTTRDIWEYHEKHLVPFNDKRYVKEDGYREAMDRTANNDYYDICVRCVSPYEAESVHCPKYNAQMPNLGKTIDWQMKREQWQFVNIDNA